MAAPSKDIFKKVVNQKRGNLTRVAEHFEVERITVYDWIKKNPGFKEIVEDARMRLFDDCLSTSEIVAHGIPEKDENGKIVGWIERPDGNMLRYLMSTLGRKEGFGESIDLTTNGKDISPARVLTLKEVKEMLSDFEKEY